MRKPRFQRNPLFINHVQELVNTLLDHVMKPEQTAIEAELDQLVEDNEAHGGSAAGFVYDGDVLSLYPPSVLRGRSILPIYVGLEDRAQAHVERRNKLKHDRQRIEAGFSVVTPKCKTTQDIRDVLPDNLAALVEQISELPRTREEGFLFQNNMTLKRQFQANMDLLFDYQFKGQMDALAGVEPESTL